MPLIYRMFDEDSKRAWIAFSDRRDPEPHQPHCMRVVITGTRRRAAHDRVGVVGRTPTEALYRLRKIEEKMKCR